MGFDAPSHWLILAAVAVMLFGGYKKLPEMSRSLGRSLRIFKTEMKGLEDDNAARRADTEGADDTPAVPVVVSPAVTVPVAAPATPPVVPAVAQVVNGTPVNGAVVNGAPVNGAVAAPVNDGAPVQQPSSQLGV